MPLALPEGEGARLRVPPLAGDAVGVEESETSPGVGVPLPLPPGEPVEPTEREPEPEALALRRGERDALTLPESEPPPPAEEEPEGEKDVRGESEPRGDAESLERVVCDAESEEHGDALREAPPLALPPSLRDIEGDPEPEREDEGDGPPLREEPGEGVGGTAEDVPITGVADAFVEIVRGALPLPLLLGDGDALAAAVAVALPPVLRLTLGDAPPLGEPREDADAVAAAVEVREKRAVCEPPPDAEWEALAEAAAESEGAADWERAGEALVCGEAESVVAALPLEPPLPVPVAEGDAAVVCDEDVEPELEALEESLWAAVAETLSLGAALEEGVDEGLYCDESEGATLRVGVAAVVADAVPRGDAVPVLVPVPERVEETEPEELGEPVGVREGVLEEESEPLTRGELVAERLTDEEGDADTVEEGVLDGEEERLTVGVIVSASSEGEGETLTEGLPLNEGERSGEALTEGEIEVLIDFPGDRVVLAEKVPYMDSVAPAEGDGAALTDTSGEAEAPGERDSIALREDEKLSKRDAVPFGERETEGQPEGEALGNPLPLTVRLFAPAGEPV